MNADKRPMQAPPTDAAGADSVVESSAFPALEPMEEVAPGIFRQMLAHGPALMLCRVRFEGGAVGSLHTHPHAQVTYVESGRFRFHIDGEDRDLGPGESCYIAPELLHGTTCLLAGSLIDAFTPARADFLPAGVSR